MPTEIRPGVYDVTTRQDESGRRYRAFLFDDEVPVLVDAGHAGTADTLVSRLDDLGIAPERVLVTHGDGDHVGGIDAVVEHYDAELYAPAGVNTGDEPVAERVADGDHVGPFTAVHVPGHTQQHFAYVHDERSIAVLGDAVFGADLRGLPAGYFILPPAAYSEDLVQADESLARLLPYDFDVGLVYHGSSVTERAHEKLEAFVDFPGKP